MTAVLPVMLTVAGRGADLVLMALTLVLAVGVRLVADLVAVLPR